MKTSKPLQAVAITCTIIGLFFLYLIITLVITVTFLKKETDDGFLHWMATLAITPLAIPPLMATLYGIQLIRAPSKRAIKGAIGGVSIIVTLALLTLLQELIPGKLEGNYIFLLVAVIALPIYAYVSRYLIMKQLGEPIVPHEIVGRGIKGLIAIQVALAYSTAISDKLSDGPLWLPFTPILVGAFCYYLSLGLNPTRQPATIHSDSNGANAKTTSSVS